MKIIRPEIKYDGDEVTNIEAKLSELFAGTGIELISVDKNKNTNPEEPYGRTKPKGEKVESDVSSSGAGGMTSPN